MKHTLAQLRAMSPDALNALRGTQLVDALQLVRDAERGAVATLSRLNNLSDDGKSLTSRQAEDYAAAEKDLDVLGPLAETLERAANAVDRSAVPDVGGHGFVRTGDTAFRAGQPLAPEQRMVDYLNARGLVGEDERGLSLGRYVRGMLTGQWQDADAERRALVGGTATAGGHLVPAPLSARIIDRARNRTRVLQAGAQIVPMESSTLKLARVTGDPTAAWHTEMAAIAASDMTFDSVTLTARTLASRVLISRELMEDAEEVDDEVEKAFAEQFALTVDLAALYGTGTPPEPLGVKNHASVTKTSLGANGAVPIYDDLIDSVFRVRGANFEPTAQIMSNRTGQTFAKVKDSTGQYLTPPTALDGVRRLTTVQVPNNLTVGTSNVTSDIFTADWSELLIGVRTSLEITVLRERSADVGAFELLAWWRGDIAVARPAAFDVVTGVLQ